MAALLAAFDSVVEITPQARLVSPSCPVSGRRRPAVLLLAVCQASRSALTGWPAASRCHTSACRHLCSCCHYPLCLHRWALAGHPCRTPRPPSCFCTPTLTLLSHSGAPLHWEGDPYLLRVQEADPEADKSGTFEPAPGEALAAQLEALTGGSMAPVSGPTHAVTDTLWCWPARQSSTGALSMHVSYLMLPCGSCLQGTAPLSSF